RLNGKYMGTGFTHVPGDSLFLTEFGGCDDSPTCDGQLNWGFQAADRYFQSWTYWGDVYGDMVTVKRLSRPYARALTGLSNKPTEIYLSLLVYPKASYNITVNENIQWKIDPTDSNIILIEPIKQRIYSQEKNAIGFVYITAKEE
ncbi:unnamed protein product, partial [Rotaria sordida]